MQDETGATLFWWDWAWTTCEFLSHLSKGHPTKDFITVTKKNNSAYSCTELKLKEVAPKVLSEAIMSNPEVFSQIVAACRWHEVKEYTRLSVEDLRELIEAGEANRQKYATKIGWTVSDSGNIELEANGVMEEPLPEGETADAEAATPARDLLSM